MNKFNSGIKNAYLKGAFMTISSVLLLSGCSTIGGLFGGEGDELSNMEVEAQTEAEMMEPAAPTPEELLAEKDQALITQGMRIAAAEQELPNDAGRKQLIEV